MRRDKINKIIEHICSESSEAEAQLTELVRTSYSQYKSAKLKLPNVGVIRAGKNGGLPFDSLTSDLQFGCLPATQICYGNCFAAKVAFEAGLDFSHRQENRLNEAVLREDLSVLPAEQAYLRNGWNSDPSWNWEKALRLAQIISESGRMTIFITKAFVKPSDEIMRQLAAINCEIRVSVSAFDSKAQLRQRLSTIEQYRALGGVIIPLLMSAAFSDKHLQLKQQRIVEYLVDSDLPAAENSLRFEPTSPVLKVIDLEQCGQVISSSDYWAGRLFEEYIKVPTTTSVPSHYKGLQSAYLSQNSPEFLASLWFEPVHTNREVLTLHASLDKPSQCGVGVEYLD